MSAVFPSRLKEVASGEVIKAELVVGLSTDEVDEAVALWSPYLKDRIEETGQRPAHAHWDWSSKIRTIRGISGYVVAGLRANGDMQGLLLWDDLLSRAKHPAQLGRELVYIHFVSTAPWNDQEITDTPRFRGAGTQLVAAAVCHSFDQEFKGRLGLHSLPKAEEFYRDRCGMADLGIDTSHDNLRYFEFTQELSTAFLKRTEVKR